MTALIVIVLVFAAAYALKPGFRDWVNSAFKTLG